MRKIVLSCVVSATAFFATPAFAQMTEVPFEGAYAGVEAGAYEQHFYLETTGVTPSSGGYRRNLTYAGGVIGGYDVAIMPQLRLGGEIGAILGGGNNTASFGPSSRLSYQSRFGYRLSLRGGVVVTPQLLLYASGGYGGNRYRITNTAGIGNVHEWGSSFIVGAGAEYRVSKRVSLRFDFKHLDNESSQFFLGVPVRF